MIRTNSIILSIIIVFSLFSFGTQAQSGELKRASFIPLWSPQAQFAGYYVALDKGLYKKHGIDLNMLVGGPYRLSTDALEKDEADFATIWLSTAIQRRSQGVKLVNIGQIIQRSALILVAKKARGIHRPEDIQGKKVGLWGADFRLQPLAFLKKYNLKVTIVPQSYSVNLFLRDGVDVASAMWYNEYHTILNAGLNADELTTFFFYEHGLNFPEDGLYTMESTLKRDPELVRAFVKASIEGWQYAFQHPDEALDIVLKHMATANVPVNRVHQKWMLEKVKELIAPEDSEAPAVGTLAESDFLRVAKELKDNGLIKEPPHYKAFHISVINNVKE